MPTAAWPACAATASSCARRWSSGPTGGAARWRGSPGAGAGAGAGPGGADPPHLESASGRACYYAYWEDPRDEWQTTAAQWREGPELGTAFPCDGGLTLVLLQPPLDRASEFRADLAGAYARTVASIPGLRERLDGCRQESKV